MQTVSDMDCGIQKCRQ